MQTNETPKSAPNRPKIPRAELRKLIDASFTYERRKFIFWSFNTTYLGIALFQIYSDVNLEGGDNPALCTDATIGLGNEDDICPIAIFNLMVAYIIAHMSQIITGVIGYFGIDQKSRKVNKSYQCIEALLSFIDLLFLSCLLNTVFAIALIAHIGRLDGTPFENTKHEFLMLLITFPLVQIIMAYFCLNQFRKASQENFNVQHEKELLIENHNDMVIDVAKYFITQ